MISPVGKSRLSDRLLVLAILLTELLATWARRHPEILAEGPDVEVAIPREFKADVAKLNRLLTRADRDVGAYAPMLQTFQHILDRLKPSDHPAFYASVVNDLGTIFMDLPLGDRSANITQAIACFQEALRYRTPETTPRDYSSTQTNLGCAYHSLPTGDHAANLLRAIECFQEALRFQSFEGQPWLYAQTQTNLGNAYKDLLA